MERRTLATPQGEIVYWVGGPSADVGADVGEPGAAVGEPGAGADEPGADVPTLVFLPGLTADHRLFDRQVERFESFAPCLVWDPPSHGQSRPFPLTWSLDDLACWLGQILDAEGVARPLLVGQSMGGYVSQAFMDLFPGRAAGFVSIDSAPLQRRYYPSWEVAFLSHTEGMYRAIPWGLLRKWGPWGTAQSDYGRRLMAAFMDDYDKGGYCALTAWGYKVLAQAIKADRPYEVDCPALLICGTKDQAGDVRPFNRKWTVGSGLPLHWIEGAGHNANTDCPDRVNELIQRLLTQVTQG